MDTAPGTGRWLARPWRARALRTFVYVLPIFGSLVFVRAVAGATGPPTSSLAVYLAWWFSLSIGATIVVSGLYALTRRLLPLGALLELSLVFPDEAPSRFRVAMQTGTVEELEKRLRALGETATPAEAATILLRLVAALDVHDRITRGHAERVRAYSASIGRELGLAADELDRLNWAALLHDIGKLDVSAEILNKPGRPTDEEWEQLRVHPLRGETLVAPLEHWLGEWTGAVGYHHERWDGKGYPRGVAGDEIPFAGRIVAIADVFDVITSSRSYKRAASAAEARAEIASCAGAQFDPRLVRTFLNMSLGRMRLVLGPVSWLTHAPFLARLPLTPTFGATILGAAALATTAATGLAQPRATVAAEASPSPAVAAAPTPHAGVQPVVELNVAPRQTASPSRARKKARRRPRRHGTAAPRIDPRAPAPTVTVAVADPTQPPSTPDAPKPGGSGGSAPASTADTPKGTGSGTTKPGNPKTPATTTTTTITTTTTTTTTTPKKPPPTTITTTTSPAPPPPNVAPTFSLAGSQTVLEDAGAQQVSGFGSGISPGPAGETGQTVTFSVTTDHSSLFSTQPALSSTGTLTYTTAPNANGTATVTVVAHDDGGTANGGSDTSAPQTFTISVTPVNDAPSFVAGSNQTAVSLLGAQTVTGWATGISAGPSDEAGQTVTFVVTVDKPGLFATLPAVASNGTLTYKPTLIALGTVTVTVRAVDSGGTANGGVDTSPPQTFTITIA
jgi:hypothetical protein